MTKVCWLRLCIHNFVTLTLSSALRPSVLTLGKEGSHISFLINLTGCSGHPTFLTRLHHVAMHSSFPWPTTDVLLKPSHTSDDLESLLQRRFWLRRSGVRLRLTFPRGPEARPGLLVCEPCFEEWGSLGLFWSPHQGWTAQIFTEDVISSLGSLSRISSVFSPTVH